MLTTQPLQCPISLETPPLCPQITPCGHVFAFPSIMAHLMHHGGDNLRKASPCPLCFHPIVARELRLVHTHLVQQPKVAPSHGLGRSHGIQCPLHGRSWHACMTNASLTGQRSPPGPLDVLATFLSSMTGDTQHPKTDIQ
jgi:hypothetical protein